MYCHSCGSHQATGTSFCGVCDTRKRHSDVQLETNQEELIKSCFLYGFDYQTICMFLEKFHGITISLRTLKRRLADHRLNKIGSDISDASLQVIIEREVNGPSSLKGYRNVWNKLRVTYGLKVSGNKVMEILRKIDPVNSALRKARKLSTVIRFNEVCLQVNKYSQKVKMNCH